VDDGVRSLDEALAELREAARLGIVAVACTPHVWLRETGDLAALLDERRRIHERLVEAAEAEGGLPRIGLGAEVLILDRPVPLGPPGMRINAGPYALVELPFHRGGFDDLRDVFRRVIDAGVRPVLAHVERYASLRDDERLDRWREDGLLAQVNASSLVGEHGPEIRSRAFHLVASGRADVVASDVHGPHMRRNSLADAAVIVEGLAGEDAVRRLFVETPRAIFEGREVRPGARRGEGAGRPPQPPAAEAAGAGT
jgi:protein-tyrosine phosphatase